MVPDSSGSRFRVLVSEEGEEGAGHVETTLVKLGCSVIEVVNMEEDKADRPNCAAGPNAVKVKNETGGKNPQPGPRVRDAKKLARGLGIHKKGNSSKLGSGPIQKENSSWKKGHGGGIVGYKDVTQLARELLEEDKRKMLEGNFFSLPSHSSKKLLSSFDARDDPNPLLGFINGTFEQGKEDGKRKGVIPLEDNVVQVMEGMLSEQSNPNLSK